MGHNWHPYAVTHPQLEGPFNDDGAWEFIADHLDGETPVRWRPASEKHPQPALEMIIDISNSDRRLYMKVGLILGRDMVLGLSFHYSNEDY